VRLPPVAPALTLTLVLIAGAAPGRAQGTLETARGLYASAAYDEALAMLEKVPTEGLDADARVSLDHYRMLCLLALGRSAEVDGVVASLLEVHPSYRMAQDDASPRVMMAFLDARRRVLPEVVRKRYDHARTLYASRDYAAAATEFAVVRTLVLDAEMAGVDGRLADLGQLSADYEDLSRAAEERKVAEARAAAEAAEKAREAERTEAARAAAVPPAPIPPPEPADGIYGAADAGVVPPVAIRQDISRWRGPTPPPMAGTPLGVVRIVIDEQGAVTEASVVSSVSGFYDLLLMESVKGWQYRPATKAGRPVKFRRVVSLSSR
jgi:hypothetical protein